MSDTYEQSESYQQQEQSIKELCEEITALKADLSCQSDHFATVCAEYEAERKCSKIEVDVLLGKIIRLTTEQDAKEKVVEAAKASRNASNPDEMQHSLLLLSDALDTHDNAVEVVPKEKDKANADNS